jgi:hypothetical protein
LYCDPRSFLGKGLRRVVLGFVAAFGLDSVEVEFESAVATGMAWVAIVEAEIIFLLVLLFLYR